MCFTQILPNLRTPSKLERTTFPAVRDSWRTELPVAFITWANGAYARRPSETPPFLRDALRVRLDPFRAILNGIYILYAFQNISNIHEHKAGLCRLTREVLKVVNQIH